MKTRYYLVIFLLSFNTLFIHIAWMTDECHVTEITNYKIETSNNLSTSNCTILCIASINISCIVLLTLIKKLSKVSNIITIIATSYDSLKFPPIGKPPKPFIVLFTKLHQNIYNPSH